MRKWQGTRFCLLALALSGALGGCFEPDYVLSKHEPGEGNTPPNLSLEACPYNPGTDLRVCTATYLSSAEPTTANAIVIAPDDSLWVAGSFGAFPPSLDERATRTELLGGTTATLLRLDPIATSVSSVTSIGEHVSDLAAVSSDGSLVLASNMGVTRLDREGSRVLWHYSEAGEAKRVATTRDGQVAALVSGAVVVLDSTGQLQTRIPISDPIVEDVAVEANRALTRVFVVGAHGVTDCEGRVPYLRAYDLQGAVLWRAYDFEQAFGNCASSHGYRVIVGPDQKLYYGGTQQGGNSVHLKDPKNLALEAPLVSYDAYNQGFGKAILEYTFFARFDPETGALEAGQLLLPRDGEVGGQLSLKALNADQSGNVYLGGQASCCLEKRNDLSINGAKVGPYDGGDSSFGVVAGSLLQRLTWATFTKTGASASVVDIAVGTHTVAVLVQQDGAGSLFTDRSLVAESMAPRASLIAVLQNPAFTDTSPPAQAPPKRAGLSPATRPSTFGSR